MGRAVTASDRAHVGTRIPAGSHGALLGVTTLTNTHEVHADEPKSYP